MPAVMTEPPCVRCGRRDMPINDPLGPRPRCNICLRIELIDPFATDPVTSIRAALRKAGAAR
jgi:hypothetical protein